MTFADHARLLIEYNEYANARVLEAALSLDAPALEAEAGASKGSILGNLQHIVAAQLVWQSRLTGEQPARTDVTTREGLVDAYRRSHEGLRAFAASLTEADWSRDLAYTDTKGVSQSASVGVIITHLVNHGTLHRGEAGMLLAAHGRSPGDLDFVLYVLERVR